MNCIISICQKEITEGIIINSPITQGIDRKTNKMVKIHLMEVVCFQCFKQFDVKSNNMGSVKIIT